MTVFFSWINLPPICKHWKIFLIYTLQGRIWINLYTTILPRESANDALPPTRTASASARILWTIVRAASPLIHRDSPEEAAIWPSIETASFNVTNGFPDFIHRQ